MTEPPRRLPPSEAERLRVVVNRMAPGSAAGQTRSARPVAPNTRAAARTIAGSVSGASVDPVVIGTGASGAGSGDVAVGLNAAAANDSTAMGDSSTATGLQSFAANGTATGDGAIAMNGHAAGNNAVQAGSGGSAHNDDSVALGASATTFGDRAVALGAGVIAPNDDDFMLGTPTHNVQVQGTFALTSGGATPVGPQATPVTLGDVIAILQAFGLAL